MYNAPKKHSQRQQQGQSQSARVLGKGMWSRRMLFQKISCTRTLSRCSEHQAGELLVIWDHGAGKKIWDVGRAIRQPGRPCLYLGICKNACACEGRGEGGVRVFTSDPQPRQPKGRKGLGCWYLSEPCAEALLKLLLVEQESSSHLHQPGTETPGPHAGVHQGGGCSAPQLWVVTPSFTIPLHNWVQRLVRSGNVRNTQMYARRDTF